jgi:hypothetical protein
MRLSKVVNPIAPSLKGRSTAEGPFSDRAVEALSGSATS